MLDRIGPRVNEVLEPERFGHLRLLLAILTKRNSKYKHVVARPWVTSAPPPLPSKE